MQRIVSNVNGIDYKVSDANDFVDFVKQARNALSGYVDETLPECITSRQDAKDFTKNIWKKAHDYVDYMVCEEMVYVNEFGQATSGDTEGYYDMVGISNKADDFLDLFPATEEEEKAEEKCAMDNLFRFYSKEVNEYEGVSTVVLGDDQIEDWEKKFVNEVNQKLGLSVEQEKLAESEESKPVVSDYSQKEYKVSDTDDFTKLVDMAENELGMNVPEVMKKYETHSNSDSSGKIQTKLFANEVLETANQYLSDMRRVGLAKRDVYKDVEKVSQFAKEFLGNIPVAQNFTKDARFTEVKQNKSFEDEKTTDKKTTNEKVTEEKLTNEKSKLLSFSATTSKSQDEKSIMTHTVESKPKQSCVMLLMNQSIIKSVKDKPDTKYATIGLNSECGKYGTLFFPAKMLRKSKANPNYTYLPMNADKAYTVVFGNRKEDRKYIKMTGKEIVNANHDYFTELRQNRVRDLEDRVHGTERIAEREKGV